MLKQKNILKIALFFILVLGGVLAISLFGADKTYADGIEDGDVITTENEDYDYLVMERDGIMYKRLLPNTYNHGETVNTVDQSAFDDLEQSYLIRRHPGATVYRVIINTQIIGNPRLEKRPVTHDVLISGSGYTYNEVYDVSADELSQSHYDIIGPTISTSGGTLTVIEGWRKEQISERMLYGNNFGWHPRTVEEFNETNHPSLMGDNSYSRDGHYFPGSYSNVSAATSQEDLGIRMVERFTGSGGFPFGAQDDVSWIDTWQELLSAASLVQREAGGAHDTRIIAGVMAHRLKLSPTNLLQLNPSVIYLRGKTDNKGWWQGPMPDPQDDKYKDHPANTYSQGGLSDYPIANPPMSTVNDVVNYVDHNYYFFLHALGSPNKINNANPIFCSKDNDQHEKYRKWFLGQLGGGDPVHIVGSNCVLGNHSLIRRSGSSAVYHIRHDGDGAGDDKFKRRVTSLSDYDYFSNDEVQVVSQSVFNQYEESNYVVEYDQKGREKVSETVWKLGRVNGVRVKERVASSKSSFSGNTASVFPITTKELNRYTEDGLFRFYNPNTGAHFYTIDHSEGVNAVNRWGFQFEGRMGSLSESGGSGKTPLYRTYNPSTGAHFYTTSHSEAMNAVNRWNFQYEGRMGYLRNSSGSSAFYRTYNPSTGAHFYTTSHSEAMNAVNRWNFQYEGRMGYLES